MTGSVPSVPQLFYPAPPSQEYLVQLIRVQYQIWREEKEAKEPQFVIENVRFEHDPLWRYRFMSIQSARDGNHPVWKVVRVVFTAASVASMPYIIGQ